MQHRFETQQLTVFSATTSPISQTASQRRITEFFYTPGEGHVCLFYIVSADIPRYPQPVFPRAVVGAWPCSALLSIFYVSAGCMT